MAWLYSPWVKWSEIVANFLKAKRLPETLKVWVNTSLGETWKESTEGIDPTGLLKRKENWGRIAPEGVMVITAGVDVQDDRLEAEIIGWGLGQESWSLQYHVIHGDPASDKVWNDLDKMLRQTIKTSDDRVLLVGAACVDTGGHHTQKVYEYCKAREHNRIFAMLKIHQPGAGYCHFPSDYSEEYFRQLTAERIQTKFVNGHPTRVWVLKKGKRNEALDCRVYGLAALHILNPNLDELAAAQERERLQQHKTKKQTQSSNWIGADDWNFN